MRRHLPPLALGLAALLAVAALVAWTLERHPLAPLAEGVIRSPSIETQTRSPAPAPQDAPVAVDAPPSPLPVAGWVIDGAGQPISGVRVTIDREDGALANLVATTGDDGAFHLTPFDGAPTVRLDGPDVFAAELRWQPGAPAPRILLTRKVTITARVVADDTPVPGAEVSLSDGSSATVATARTDADGRAAFPGLMAGAYELWAHDGARVSALGRATAVGDATARAGAEVELALGRAGALSGRLVADAAIPPGAQVTVTPIDVDHATRVVAVDADGRFELPAVPPGRWRVVATAAGMFQLADDVITVGAAPTTITIRLSRAGGVRGTVVDATGDPVAGATLVLRAQGAGAHGSHADVAPEPARGDALRWVHPLAGPRQMPLRDSRRFGAARHGARPAECGRGHCGVDLGGKRGVVVHAAADGVIARVVREIRKESGRYVMIEHAGGLRSYYMHLDEIRGDLDVGQPVVAGAPIGTVGRTGVIKSGPHLHFSIAQERAGRTTYLDPEPILRHAVVLARPAPFVEPDVLGATRVATRPGEAAAAVAPARFVTDARGAFALDGVEPGEYVAAAFHPDLAAGASAPFRVRVAETTAGVTITLSAGVVVHGRVWGEAGPLAGARVIAEEGFGETSHKVASTYTDAAGEYELRALAGSVVIAVDAAGHGATERAVFVGAATPTRLRQREDFTLIRQDARVHGEVLDPDGHAAAGVTVRIVEGPTLRRRAETDARGGFVLDRVARGRYTLELSAPDYPPQRAVVTADTFAELRLAQGARLRVELRDGHTARGLPGERVVATGPGGRTAEALTDARGFADLRGLAPGAWTLRADAAGYVDEALALDVAPGRHAQDVRLELHRGATVAGIVVDSYGRRVEGARVTAGAASTVTDRDGQFRLDDVATGAIELEVQWNDARGGQRVELRPGDELLSLQLAVSE